MPVFTQSGQERRALRARAQTLQPAAHIGQAGLTPVIPNILAAFTHTDLLKVHFDRHKESKHQLATELAEATGSELVQIIGHNAILYRPR